MSSGQIWLVKTERDCYLTVVKVYPSNITFGLHKLMAFSDIKIFFNIGRHETCKLWSLCYLL